jgi:DNA topoisomerase VI subunit B
MALRAFHSNPALGGFGGESNAAASSIIASEENCDAFAQVLKELVDNAVDACSKPGAASATRAKRVRVAIERVCQSDEDHEEYIDTPSLLRVTVSDNGCGMDDIQQCVNCFRSTKGTNADAKTTRAMDNSEDEEDDSDQEMTVKERESKEAQTAGRYGLGLTLCLLHAQRLVPGSCASITSATAEREHYTRANFVVDKDQDSVRCVKRERIVKTSRHESGTAVSLLLPVSQNTWCVGARGCVFSDPLH